MYTKDEGPYFERNLLLYDALKAFFALALSPGTYLQIFITFFIHQRMCLEDLDPYQERVPIRIPPKPF